MNTVSDLILRKRREFLNQPSDRDLTMKVLLEADCFLVNDC